MSIHKSRCHMKLTMRNTCQPTIVAASNSCNVHLARRQVRIDAASRMIFLTTALPKLTIQHCFSFSKLNGTDLMLHAHKRYKYSGVMKIVKYGNYLT
jgi:ATP-dependent Clp protease adapter protein ClpS